MVQCYGGWIVPIPYRDERQGRQPCSHIDLENIVEEHEGKENFVEGEDSGEEAKSKVVGLQMPSWGFG